MDKLIHLLTILNFKKMCKIEDETTYFYSTSNKEKNIRSIRITIRDNSEAIILVVCLNSMSYDMKKNMTMTECIPFLNHNFTKEIRQHKIKNLLNN